MNTRKNTKALRKGKSIMFDGFRIFLKKGKFHSDDIIEDYFFIGFIRLSEARTFIKTGSLK